PPPPAAADTVTVPAVTAKELAASLTDHPARLMVVNLWATWCAPCVEEMPVLTTAAASLADRDVIVIGVACDLVAGADEEKARPRVEEFVSRHASGLENYLFVGDENDLHRLFDHPGPLPYTVILRAGHERVWNHVGILHPGEIEAAVDSLLSKP
ncbi:MAG: TlpA family protein disulfide reductase, partial [Acidobacteriota bacterium]